MINNLRIQLQIAEDELQSSRAEARRLAQELSITHRLLKELSNDKTLLQKTKESDLIQTLELEFERALDKSKASFQAVAFFFLSKINGYEAAVLAKELVNFIDFSKQFLSPLLKVHNPQGVESDKNGVTFYWIGREVELEIFNFCDDDNTQSQDLHFDVFSGPANPSPQRGICLIDSNGGKKTAHFERNAHLSFPVKLRRGKNVFTLRVTNPLEQTVIFPSDPRNHMILMKNLFLKPANTIISSKRKKSVNSLRGFLFSKIQRTKNKTHSCISSV